jgi:hypothetical protein
MHTIQIPAANFERQIPSSFDEMSPPDFIRFVHLYLELQKGGISLNALKTEMVFQFLGLKYSKWRFELLQEGDKAKIYENINLISEKIDFLFTQETTEDGKINLKVNFPWTKNLIPKYGGFVGPDDMMNDITFLEYKNAHVSAIEFIKSQDETDLNWLVATLYRKPFFQWLKKPAYDEFKVKKNTERISCWPFSVKYGILLNFLTWEEHIRTGSFNIDGNDISFSILFKSSGESESTDPGTGLTGLLFTIAETGVFGNVKTTSEQNLYDVLFRLYQVQYEKMAIEKQMNKKK